MLLQSGRFGLSAPPSAPLADSFDRADNAASLGTADSGQTWSTLTGTAGILSNKAAFSALSGGVGLALVDGAPTSGYVQAVASGFSANGQNAGVAFHGSDASNFLWADVSHNPSGNNADRVRIVRVDGGVTTVLASNAALASTVITIGGTHTVRVIYDSAGQITVLVDGVSLLTHTLSSADQTKFGPFTKAGFRNDATALRWDDLSAATSASDDLQTAVLADSPLAYWPLSQSTGTPAADASGNARHLDHILGVTPGVASPVLVAGQTCYDFATGAVGLADSAWQSPHAGAAGVMTLECWIRPDTVAATQSIWRKGSANANWEFAVYFLADGTLGFLVYRLAAATTPVVNLLSVAGTITAGNVFHVVARYDKAAGLANLWVNGASVASAAPTADVSGDGTHALNFGRRSDAAQYFDGKACALAMYASYLSDARIGAHYAAGS